MFFIGTTEAEILEILESNGFEAYLVGGYVRDLSLGLIPKDSDICTNAQPEQIISLFKSLDFRISPMGLKHGTVTVIPPHQDGKGQCFEITTFKVSDCPAATLAGDLAKRDFTINAMALNRDSVLTDLHGGEADLAARTIKCVGSPYARFDADALRILRAMRLASELSFCIEYETERAMFLQKGLLSQVAAERITSELLRILAGENACYVLDRYKDIIAEVIPEIIPMFDCHQQNNYHPYTVWMHTLCAMQHTPPDQMVRLCMFLHDIGKPSSKTVGEDGIGHFYGHGKVSADMAEIILKRLRFPNKMIKSALTVILHHDIRSEATVKSTKRVLNCIGEENFWTFARVREGDILGQSYVHSFERLKKIKDIEQIALRIIAEESCFSLKHLNISGKDILDIGVPQGELVGLILKALLEEVVDEKLGNTKEDLVARAKEFPFPEPT